MSTKFGPESASSYSLLVPFSQYFASPVILIALVLSGGIGLQCAKSKPAATLERFTHSAACVNPGRLIEGQPPQTDRSATRRAEEWRALLRLRTVIEHEEHTENRYLQLARIDICLGSFDTALRLLESVSLEDNPDWLSAAGSAEFAKGLQDRSASHLLRAAAYLRQSLKLRPDDLAALTNYSEALGRLELIDVRRQVLVRLIEVETLDSWNVAHRRELLALERRVARARSGESVFADARSVLAVKSIAPWVEEYPYLARKLVEENLLGDWGEAWEAQDVAAANRSLRAAEQISLAIRGLSGDPLLFDATQIIRSSSGETRSLLAGAFAQFRRGMRIYRNREREPRLAIRHFEKSAETLHSLGLDFGFWAEHYALVLRSHAERAETTARWAELYDQLPEELLALRGHVSWRLGIARQMTGRAIEAMPWYQKSIEPLEAVSGERGSAFAYALLGNTYSDLDLVEKSWSNRLVGMRRILPTSDRWQRHSILHGAAHSLIRSQEPILAFPFLEELEINGLKWGFPSGLAELYFLKARAHAGVGEYDEALANVALGREPIADYPEGPIADWLETDGNIAEGLALVRRDPRKAASLLLQGHAAQQGLGYLYEKIPVLGGLAVANLAEGDPSSSQASQMQLINELSRLRNGLPAAADRAMSGIALGQVVDEFVSSHTFLDESLLIQITDLLKPRPRSFSEVEAAVPACEASELVECLRQNLADQEIVVTYYTGRRQLLVGVIRRSGAQLLRKPLGSPSLRSLVIEFHRSLGEARQAPPDGERLRELLLGSIDLEGIRRLIVIPDPDLQPLAFQSLPLPGSGQPIITELEVVYYPSLASMSRSRDRLRRETPPSAVTALLVAAPDLDPVLRREFPELPFARSEVDRLAELYSEHTKLLGPQATVANLQEHLPRSQVAHVAVHSVPGGPGSSLAGLLLSPTNRFPDGVLGLDTMSEIPLSETELLALSGCSTASGLRRGRAVLWGLPAAALDAGVGSVLATTAEVEDQDASRFALEFHRQFLRNRDPVAAYAATARTFIQLEGENPSARPSIWTRYRLIGD